MPAFILGAKSTQKQMFTEQGVKIPVTAIMTSSCYLLDIKTQEHNGYSSLLLGFGKCKSNRKTEEGIIKKAGVKSPLRFFREIRVKETLESIEKDNKKGIKINDSELYIGDEIKPALLFKVNDLVHVTGTSKGKGFAGVVKRHNFKGGPRTHGQSDRERAPGSIGQTTTPGRVYKGKRMAGRMGSETVTVRNLRIMAINEDGLVVKGLVPGATKGLLKVIAK
jgi:large subunit ribosomal protein L3